MQRAGISTIWLLIFTLALLGGIWTLTKTQKKEAVSGTQATITSTEVTDVDGTVLTAASSYTGKGTATRRFDGEAFTHRVMADIADPQAGKFYEGWLVLGKAGDANFDFFSTGKLEKKNQQYELTFTTKEDYPQHTGVVITEETASLGLDGIPEAHVLEGQFQ